DRAAARGRGGHRPVASCARPARHGQDDRNAGRAAMTDVGKWLKAGDPLGGEPRLDDDDARAMRRAMMAERRTTSDAAWPQPIVLAAAIAITLAAGIAVGHRLPPARGS